MKPHKIEGWQNRHPEDNEEFVAQSEKVCQTYLDAPELAAAEQVTHTRSLDEKTGFQALERVFSDLPMQPGSIAKQEWEYIRHGTLCLIAAMCVGQVLLRDFVLQGRFLYRFQCRVSTLQESHIGQFRVIVRAIHFYLV